MTLKELIANLEESFNGSRELDDEIAIALGWQRKVLRGAGLVWYAPESEHPIPVSLHYTTSLDAALKAMKP